MAERKVPAFSHALVASVQACSMEPSMEQSGIWIDGACLRHEAVRVDSYNSWGDACDLTEPCAVRLGRHVLGYHHNSAVRKLQDRR